VIRRTLSTRRQRGFSLLELLVVIVIIGILAAVAVPRFMGAQDRARIGVAEADVDLYRQALVMFNRDYGDYPVALTLANASAVLTDPLGEPYMLLPTGRNFATFSYIYIGETDPTRFEIEVMCNDMAGTVLQATPQGVRKR
jgi:general secretion pathway protein G